MEHEQWATVQIEHPSMARRGLTKLVCCYVGALAAIVTIGALGPSVTESKVYRDVDYSSAEEVQGSELQYDHTTGDALWKLKLRGMTPEKQFLLINAKLQRPGWNTGPLEARDMSMQYEQRYTLFSQLGSDRHALKISGQKSHFGQVVNHTHSHEVHCKAGRRFCEAFPLFREDFLYTSVITLEVLFSKPELSLLTGKPIPVYGPESPRSLAIAGAMLQDGTVEEEDVTAYQSNKVPPSLLPPAGRKETPQSMSYAYSSYDYNYAYGWDDDNSTLYDDDWDDFYYDYYYDDKYDVDDWDDDTDDEFAFDDDGGSNLLLKSTDAPSLAPSHVQPSPMPTVDFFDFHANATWTVLLEKVTANEDFTRYELSLRYAFLATTLVVLVTYVANLTRLSVHMWGYQQKWILVLLVGLVLFDGPLEYMRVHARQMGTGSVVDTGEAYVSKVTARVLGQVGTAFSSGFVALLMVYFLCLLEEMGSGCTACTLLGGPPRVLAAASQCGAGNGEYGRLFGNGVKGCLVGSVWGLTLASSLVLESLRQADPSFTLTEQDERSYRRFLPLFVSLGCLVAVYLCWLLSLVLDATRALLDLSPPFRFIAAATLFTAGVSLAGPWVGAFFSYPASALAFAAYLGALNLYVYTLAFSYMPRLDGLALANTDEDEDDDIGMASKLELKVACEDFGAEMDGMDL